MFELAVTMKLCVLFVCGALVSTFISTSDALKAPALHIKDLGKRQLGHCSAEYVDEFIFTGIGLICASTLQNASTYEEYNEFFCTGACAEAYLMLYAECNSPADVQFYRANCGRRDPDGKLCANIDTEQSNLGSPVLANATSNCPDSDSCSEACKASIAAGKETYGCCLNNYLNDSVVATHTGLSNYSYLASIDLWSACGVPTDIGFCYGSAWAKSSSAVFGAALIAALMSLVI